MPPHSPTARRAATIMAPVLVTPLLFAVPAHAAPCRLADRQKGTCNLTVRKPGRSGGGGGGGGGSRGPSGPVIPPPPVELTADEAQDFITTPGAAAPVQAAAPTTADLVASAQDATTFPKPVVRTAPADKTYVGLRTSLWVENFGNVQTDPISLGGQTVQLVAEPKSVTWDLGEKKIVCRDAGSKDGKTCNYSYRRSSAAQPGGSYKITATITWDVGWTCTGTGCDEPGGDLGPQPTTSVPTPLIVSEIQTNTGQ